MPIVYIVTINVSINRMIMYYDDTLPRVAKCHRYGRCICVKILEGWGKRWKRPRSFIKLSILLVNSTNFDVVLSLNQSYLIPFLLEVAIFLNFIQLKCEICRDLLTFHGVKFGVKDLLCVKYMTFRNSDSSLTNSAFIEIVNLECYLASRTRITPKAP